MRWLLGSRTGQRGLYSLRTYQDDGTRIDAPLIFTRSSHIASIKSDWNGDMFPKCHCLSASFEPYAGSGFLRKKANWRGEPRFGDREWGPTYFYLLPYDGDNDTFVA